MHEKDKAIDRFHELMEKREELLGEAYSLRMEAKSLLPDIFGYEWGFSMSPEEGHRILKRAKR